MEDIYTYEERTNKGMARFKTIEDMWKFITDDGNQHECEGRRIYVDVPKTGEVAKRECAVRKVVHLIIKKGGGDGETIKKGLDISYQSGYIWKGDTQLAEWDWKEQKMTLMGEVAEYTTEFNALMAE